MDTWDVYKKAMIVFSKIVKSRLNVSEHDFLNGYVLAKESCDGILKKQKYFNTPNILTLPYMESSEPILQKPHCKNC